MPIRTTALSLLLALAVSTASAAVSVNFLSVSPGYRGPVAMSPGSPAFNNPWLGVYNWSGDTASYETFCIDLETGVTSNPVSYACVELTDARQNGETGGPLSVFRADLLELLWGQFRTAIVDNSTGGAFQLAVYEIVYDGDSMVFGVDGLLLPGYNFPAGIFDGTAPSGSAAEQAGWAIAENWLSTLDLDGARTELTAWTSSTSQDQILDGELLTVGVEPSSWSTIKGLYR